VPNTQIQRMIAKDQVKKLEEREVEERRKARGALSVSREKAKEWGEGFFNKERKIAHNERREGRASRGPGSKKTLEYKQRQKSSFRPGKGDQQR